MPSNPSVARPIMGEIKGAVQRMKQASNKPDIGPDAASNLSRLLSVIDLDCPLSRFARCALDEDDNNHVSLHLIFLLAPAGSDRRSTIALLHPAQHNPFLRRERVA